MAQKGSWSGVMEPEEEGDFVTLSCGGGAWGWTNGLL